MALGQFSDEQLDLLSERVPMGAVERPEVDRMLRERTQRRVLTGLYEHERTVGVADADKPLFIKAFGAGLGLDLRDRTSEEAVEFLSGSPDVNESFERVRSSLKKLHGEEGIDPFLGLSGDEQAKRVRNIKEFEQLQTGVKAAVGVQPGSMVPSMPPIKPVTDAEVAAGVTKQKEDAFWSSPKLVRDALWPKMVPEAQQAAVKSIFYKNPARAMDAIDPLLEGLPPEQIRMFSAVALAARPELKKSFDERFGLTFEKVFQRRKENAKYFVRSIGAERPGNPLGFYNAAQDVFGENGFETYLENPDAEGGKKFEQLRKRAEQDFNTVAMPGMSGMEYRQLPQKVPLSDEDLVGFYKAGKQQVDWEKRYRAVSNAVVEKYKPLPSFQEYMLGGHEVVVDMVSLAAATYAGNIVAPGSGTAFALGATWMDHQAEMERTLIYDHGMKPVDAKLWTGLAAVPYAAVEYAELKGFSDFSFRGLETANRSLNRSIPNLFMTYFPQYLKRAGVGTVKETGEEVLQGAVDFALMETVRNLYETEGLTFDGNAKAFWDEAVGAVKYMWMAGLVGGQVTGAMQGTADVLRGGGVKGFFAPEFKMAVRDRTLPLEEFEAEVGLRRARTDATRLRAESGFKDGVPENVLELVRVTRGDDVNTEVDIESEISKLGYENPAAVVEMAHAELDVRDKTREVIQSKINTLDRMMDAERGQDEFVVPKNGPKFGMVELALNGWASGLDVALDVVATPEEFSQKYGVGEGVAVKAANMRKTGGGWQVVLVDSMLKSNADAYAQFRHEVLGHVGFDLSKNGPEVVGRIAGLVGLDYIKSRLPQYAKLHEAGKLTDAGLVQEFLAVLAGDLRRASASDADKGMLEKLKEGFVRSLGVESAGSMTAREVVDLARQVMGEAFKAGSMQKNDGSGSQRAYDEQQKNAGKDLKKRKAAAEKQIQQMADENPVIKMVLENGGVQMPAGKEKSWPEEYQAIPKRFRGVKGAGLSLDQLADQAAALKGTTADYSTSEFRAELEAFEAKAERVLEAAQSGKGTQDQSDEESRLIADLESGKITEDEYNAAMAELTGARFSVEQLGFDLGGAADQAQTGGLFDGVKSPGRQTSLFNQSKAAESALGAELFSDEQRTAPLAKKKIQDFGEVIHGARKHYAEEYLSRAKQGELLDVAAEPMSKSWPEPDYQKLLDGGTDAGVVAFIHASRDEVPNKPRSGWKLRKYVQVVDQLRGLSNQLLRGEISSENIRALLSRPEFSQISLNVGGRAELYAKVGHAKSLKGVYVTQGTYTMFNGVPYSPAKVIWSVEKRESNSQSGNWPRMMATGESRQEAVEKFAAAYAGFNDAQKKGKEVEFNLYRKRGQEGVIVGKKIGRNYVDLMVLPDVKAARDYLKNNRAELERKLEDYKKIPEERRAENSPRVGDDYRKGSDVTPEQFQNTFGFRGVQFGNYVEDDRRQADLNNAYDALMDLALLLDIPPAAVSLNGELGLAFGARGHGGKEAPSAHYEPVQVVINLTKRAGPGSLAHEWWHALDNYFSRTGGKPAGYMTGVIPGTAGVRQEMVQAFGNIQEAIRKSGLPERSKLLDARRSTPYWSEMIEMSARTFEAFVKSRMDQTNIENDYLVNFKDMVDYIVQSFAAKEMYPYLLDEEKDAVNSAFNALFETVQSRETEKGTALFSIEQMEDGRRAVVLEMARLIMADQERGATKSTVTKAKVQETLISVGVRADKAMAQEDLERAKEIVGLVRAQRSMGGDLNRLMAQAEINTHYGRQLEEAHKMGERGGRIWQQAQDEVDQRRSERIKYARQIAVGLTSGELDDKNHIDLENLWKKLIIEERVRKPRQAKETDKEYGERPKGTPLPDDLKLDITNDEYALEIRDWLHEVRRAVYRQLMFNKAPVPMEFQKAWKDPIVKAAYMQTVENLLREKVQDLTYGEKRDKLVKRIEDLGTRKQLDKYENAVAGIMDEMFNTAVDQNRQEWISQAWTELEKVGGALKSRQSKYARQLSGRAELMFREIKGVMALDEEALANEINTELAKLDDETNLDAQQAIRDRLSVLDRFGGLQYKKLGDIADAVTWLHDTMAEELEKQQEVVERRKVAAKSWKATIIDSLPKKRIAPDGVAGGVRNMFTRAMPVKLRLRDLVRYGVPAAVEKARAQVEEYSSQLADANTRKELEDNQHLLWIKNTLMALYKTEDAGAVWHDLVHERDEYAQYSDDNLPMSKTQLMQLVATFSQADFAKRAQMVLKYESTISALAQEMGISLADLKGTPAVAYAGMDITKELARREKIDPFQVSQLMYAAVEEGSRLGRQYNTALKIIDDGVLSDADFELINKLRRWYAMSRGALSAALENITGLPIPANMDPNYVPVKKQYEKGGINGGGQRMPVTPAGLSRRVENYRSFDESADILSLWHSRMQENSQFKHFGSLYQDLGVLFNDPDVLHKARVAHGEKFVKGLTDHLTDIMSGKPATVKSDSLGATLVNLKAFTALGFNLSLFPRQWIGGLPSFGYFVTAKEIAGYVADLTSAEGRAAFTMILNSDWAKSRRQTGNTQILNESMAKIDRFKILRKYKEYAMMPSMWGDSFSIATFGQGFYRAQRVEAARRGIETEEQIHEFAMNRLWEISNLSQQSGAVMNRSEWQRSGSWADRAFGMFTSGPQQQMSFQIDAYREWKSIQGDPERKAAALKQFAKVGFINHVLVPLGYNGIKIMVNALLRAGFDEDDAKEMLISMIMGPFGGLYIGGTVLQTMAETLIDGEQFFKSDFTPVSGVLQDAELMAVAARAIVTLEFSELPRIFDDALKNNFAPYRDGKKIKEGWFE
jgi:hypothetical protein